MPGAELTTLREYRDQGYRIYLHCEPKIGRCSHYAEMRWDQLIQYFGVDFEIVPNRARFLSLFRCEKCGGKDISPILAAPTTGGYNADPSGAHRHGPPPEPAPVDPATLAEREFEAKRMAFFRDEDARQRAAYKERVKMEERAAKGIFDIGPPDPRKLWTARPKMRK